MTETPSHSTLTPQRAATTNELSLVRGSDREEDECAEELQNRFGATKLVEGGVVEEVPRGCKMGGRNEMRPSEL